MYGREKGEEDERKEKGGRKTKEGEKKTYPLRTSS